MIFAEAGTDGSVKNWRQYMEPNTLVNSDSLKFLERVKNESASLLYFDPPAGTSREADLNSLRALYLHTTCHAKRILQTNGVLAWHVLPDRVSDVRTCLDRVFGSQHFVTEIILKRRRLANAISPATNHTTLIVYSKTNDFKYVAPTRPADARLYSKSDENGPYKLIDLSTSLNRPALQFSWHNQCPSNGRSWRYDMATLERMNAEGRIFYSESSLPREKVYLSDSASEEIGSVWDDIDLPPSERIKDYREGQQSLALLTRIIAMFTIVDDIIIDPFCGSGTSLLAATQIGRKWIGADSSETTCSLALSRLQEDVGCVTNMISGNEFQSIPIQSGLTELIRALPKPVETQHADIHQLIVSNESKTLEFKQTLSLDIKSRTKEKYLEMMCIKTIAGFLNSDGGTLLVGITDDNAIYGLDVEITHLHKGSNDNLLKHFKNLLREHIGENFYPMIDHNLIPVDGKYILRVDCAKSNQPCFVGDDFYVRTNPATDKLTGQKMYDYMKARF